ncbi:MAG: 6-phospho-beta-glucosidase, partial [Chloroflexota bacterium]
RWLRRSPASVKTELFGLHHLSWTRRAFVDGRDVLPELLRDDQFINATHLRFFGADLVRRMGMFLHEYLYYYYFRDVALERIKQEGQTRGEEVEMLNRALFETLRGLTPSEALRAYEAYNNRRNAGYMAYAESDEQVRAERSHPSENVRALHQAEVGSYAGAALRAGLALTQDQPLRIGLNVPNAGAITGMQNDDIVEITCDVDGSGAHPLSMGQIPEDSYLLMRAVKRYERLAVQAIFNRDRTLAVEALAAHPLIGSYHSAALLVEDYLSAHRDYVGVWN